MRHIGSHVASDGALAQLAAEVHGLATRFEHATEANTGNESLARLESRISASADYASRLVNLATLRAPIDAFFDGVMVNAEDPDVRRNRLALLQRFDAMCRDVAAAKPQAIAIVCTNMRGPLIAPRLEGELGIPVLDSVAFTLWGCLAAACVDMRPLREFGRMFACLPADAPAPW